jgi:ABC-type multidrug transport system fused ATPase/permease subunit
LVTRVATGITAIETATGEKISLLLAMIVQGFGAIFLSFFICWEMSLMMLCALPPLMIGMIFFMKSMVAYAQR